MTNKELKDYQRYILLWSKVSSGNLALNRRNIQRLEKFKKKYPTKENVSEEDLVF